MQTKPKITRVRVRGLTNEVFFRFMTEYRWYYGDYNPQTLEIASFMPKYDSALADLTDTLERIRKSPNTATPWRNISGDVGGVSPNRKTPVQASRRSA